MWNHNCYYGNLLEDLVLKTLTQHLLCQKWNLFILFCLYAAWPVILIIYRRVSHRLLLNTHLFSSLIIRDNHWHGKPWHFTLARNAFNNSAGLTECSDYLQITDVDVLLIKNKNCLTLHCSFFLSISLSCELLLFLLLLLHVVGLFAVFPDSISVQRALIRWTVHHAWSL